MVGRLLVDVFVYVLGGIMSKTVTSSEARDNFGVLLRQASEENEEVVVTILQRPTAVIISYAEYQELLQLRQMQKRLAAMEKLRAIRQRVQQRISEDDLTPEHAYKLAGFSDEATKNIIENDRQLEMG